MQGDILQQATVFLAATLVSVPIAKKLGFGSIIGYLVAGVIIGPFVLGFIGEEGEDLMHASEFGVVMMLFLIGLELNPQSIWRMRKIILGMGLSQMALTTISMFSILFWIFNFPFNASLVIALSFSMSSTAIALQTLKEKGIGKTKVGKSTFAVLLMQDIGVIPVLAILPLLAVKTSNVVGTNNTSNQVLISLGAIAVVVIVGIYFINPFLRAIAKTRIKELFTAASLLIIIGVAYLMQLAGISAALGAFLAGVLLANSEFRHELESDIEPFKGLLLGLFFTAVGSTINFHLIYNEAGLVFLLVFITMLVKALILLAVGKQFNIKIDQNIAFAFFLCQVGEFAFVLLASAQQNSLMDKHIIEICMAVTTITMAISPILIFINERFIDPYLGTKTKVKEREADKVEEKHKVILAGFGHFGSTIGRFLLANGVEATILDNDSEQVELLRKMGFKVYYGDCTRFEILKAAGAEDAKFIICTINDEAGSHTLAEVVQKHFPQAQLFVRTKHRYHTYDLMEKGVTKTYRETLHTSVFMGVDVLKSMGYRSYTATRKAQEFLKYDEAAIKRLSEVWKEKDNYILSVKEEMELQEKLLKDDKRFLSELFDDNAWDRDILRANTVK
ncbi:MAG TPA: monovalent cation:proton antiporter-2 (CPA2) family protein [Chitinophagaceae bacterium]|nr:monovalent cation:proton antiporter-2 (CPA2) family protein [Chitinophagaceae bacterium]